VVLLKEIAGNVIVASAVMWSEVSVFSVMRKRVENPAMTFPIQKRIKMNY